MMPLQGIAATCINNLRVTLNGRSTFNANQLYAYRAYLDMQLGVPYGQRIKRLRKAGWFESTDPEDADGAGVKLAMKTFAAGKKVECMTPVFAGMFQQPRLLIPQVELGLELRMNDDDITVKALEAGNDKQYQLELVNCRLYVRSVTLSDGLALSINEQLQKEPARYPIRRVEMKTEFINAARLEYNCTLFAEQAPKKVFAALVGGRSYKGDHHMNPFKFQKHGVADIHVRFGASTVPNILYRPLDWNNREYMRAFEDLWNACDPVDIGISPDQFAQCHTIYAFNLANYMTDEGVWDLTVQGSVSVHINFAQAVPEGGLQLIVMAVSDALVLIDQYRTVTTDLNV
ncbi:Protein F19G12.2 [Aphelenchoides avenae]|nr:Protein F19G12.2 [Aphelenchus avenae]